MITEAGNKNERIIFSVFVVAAVLINLAVIAFLDLETSRLARLITLVLFFVYYRILKSFTNSWIALALLLFLIRDVFFQFYEEPWGYKLYIILGVLVYSTLVLERFPKLSDLKFNPGVLIVTSLLVAANTYVLYVVMNMQMVTYTFHDDLESILFYIYGGSMIILGVQAMTYNSKYNSNRSLLYIFFAFGFIFSDIAALFAYYFEFDLFYFFDRVFFLLGLGLLVKYGLNYENINEEYFQYEMIDEDL